MKTNLKVYTLTGAGTEIANFNVEDTFEKYIIKGSATSIGNYAISVTGTPQTGETFIVKYKGVLDITTNGNTFSILGQSLTQNQLISDLDIEAYYDGSAWIVEIKPSFTSAVVENSNLVNSTIANAKLAQMSSYTLKGNNTGSTATPQDISINTLINTFAWKVTGNSGTTAGTNFLGTTDGQDLVFKTNNNESGRIDLSLNSTAFGASALSFVGRTGDRNAAFGTSSMEVNDTGYNNTAVGHNSLQFNITGYKNTAVGKSSLQNLNGGIFNTGLGETSGSTLTTGNYNTIIGATANVDSASSSKRIAIGYGALADQDTMFALPDDVTKFKWRGITYTLPSADGTAGQSLKTMGDGTLYWG